VLRSAALVDPRVIDLINSEFVPVWINVRTQAVPPFPFLDQVLVNGRLDENRRIVDPFSEGFFLRSLVVTADGGTLLNPQSPTVGGSIGRFIIGGAFSYAQVDPGDYLTMLEHALARLRDLRHDPQRGIARR
jgi:hypothetical protein